MWGVAQAGLSLRCRHFGDAPRGCWLRPVLTGYVPVMIVVVAALKGAVAKTTTSIHLAAVAAASRRSVILLDADPQASAAEWFELADDESLERITLAEAPTDRLLAKARDRIDPGGIAVVDMPPATSGSLAKAIIAAV